VASAAVPVRSPFASMSNTIERIRSDGSLGRYLPKIVYVLSGGAASGLCHLGMIEALENRGITPDLIVGTSAGSLFGALYSHFGNVKGVFALVESVLASDQFKDFEKKYFGEKKPADGHMQSRIKGFLSGLAGTVMSGMRLGKALVTSAMVTEKDALSIFGRIFEGITFQTLKIPFAAVAVDLAGGVSVAFDRDLESAAPGTEGLMKAVMASCAIPFIFPAVEIGGHAHTDGYIMANLPVREARTLLAGAEGFFVGFDVSAPVELAEDDLSTVELILRLLELSTRSKQRLDRDLLDVLLQPVDRHYAWSSFAEYATFFETGRRYMTEDRLRAFERAYCAKCIDNARKDTNLMRRLFSGAKLRRHLAGG
jgi:NTE family protein